MPSTTAIPPPYSITVSAHRWRCGGSVPGLPELVILGYADLKEAMPLAEHRHRDAYEFVFIELGQARWKVGGEVYETKAGNVFITLPNEAHRGLYDVIAPCRLWWLVLAAPSSHDETAGWLGLPASEMHLVLAALQKLPRRVSIMDGSAVTALRRLRQSITRPGVFESIERRLAVLDFIVAILRQYEAVKEETRFSWGLRQVLFRLESTPGKRVKVSELAAAAGMSEPHFYRLFQAETGYSPLAYASAIRIEEACRLLRESTLSVTDIAFELGFSSSQHFATAFKKHTGHAPTEWRRRYSQD